MNKNLLRQAQELQAKMAKAEEELGKETVESTSGGGVVTVVVTGKQRVLSIKIAQEVVDPEEVELLEDLVMAALNEGLERSQELAASRLSALTGNFNLPGLR